MKQDSDQVGVPKIGRPLSFNRDQALNDAMLAFWKHGFETTSMSYLTKQMKMNAPSIYLAFGDKKALFLEALEKYVGNLDQIKAFVEKSSSAFDAAEQLLNQSAIRFTGRDTPAGCLLASATASGSIESTDVQTVAAKTRGKIESFLKNRIERDIKNGILPKATSAQGLASLTIAVIQGMSVLARDGASRKKLLLMVTVAMSAWPSNS